MWIRKELGRSRTRETFKDAFLTLFTKKIKGNVSVIQNQTNFFVT